MKKSKFPIIITMSLFSMPILLICIWAILFSSYYTAFIAFIGVAASLPIKTDSKRFWLTRMAVFITGSILLVTTYQVSINEINSRIGSLARKCRGNVGTSLFSTREKLGIYGLNIIMGTTAYPIYPEASKETLMLILPPPENGIRVIYSDFPLGSQKIRKVIKEFKIRLADSQNEEKPRLQQRIIWPVSEYSFGKSEARYALALNPAYISLTALRNGLGWSIHSSITVKIRYPQSSYVTLLSRPELKVEEGLFWVLQQSGWLHPYTAEWKFVINSDDKRIN